MAKPVLPEALKDFEPYIDSNGQIHSNKAGSNNGNLYTSWACVLALKKTESRDEQIAIARYWRSVILKSELPFGVFTRGPGSTIPNSHDDYRGIAFASYFCNPTVAARIYQHGIENFGFFVDQEPNSWSNFFKQWLWRFPDFWLTVKLAASKPIDLIDKTLIAAYLLWNSRPSKKDCHQWFWGAMLYALIQELLDTESSWILKASAARFERSFKHQYRFAMADLWFSYTQDENFPLSKKEWYRG